MLACKVLVCARLWLTLLITAYHIGRGTASPRRRDAVERVVCSAATNTLGCSRAAADQLLALDTAPGLFPRRSSSLLQAATSEVRKSLAPRELHDPVPAPDATGADRHLQTHGVAQAETLQQTPLAMAMAAVRNALGQLAQRLRAHACGHNWGAYIGLLVPSTIFVCIFLVSLLPCAASQRLQHSQSCQVQHKATSTICTSFPSPNEVHGVQYQETSVHALQSSRDEDDALLYPDLVVDQEKECVLVLPLRLYTQGNCSVDITDERGNCILRAILQIRDRTQTSSPLASTLSARSPSGGSFSLRFTSLRLTLQLPSGRLCAECWTTTSKEFVFNDSHGDYFATLSHVESAEEYVLMTKTGAKFYFTGSVQKSLQISGPEVLCITERSAPDINLGYETYRARLASGADAGLLVCGLVCVQALTMCT